MSVFAPWVRSGLIGAVTTPDPLTGPLPVHAPLTVTSTVTPAAPRPVSLRVQGPGDVVSLDRAVVSRTEPADGAGDAEPNYFCAVELTLPELPWMFTPAAPAGERLRPWIVLVVVAADAAELDPGQGDRLAVLHVADVRAELPDLSQSHAWAHAQAETAANGGLGPGAVARLVCPRLLRPDTAYIAAVVPAFEHGRLAGLGLPVPDTATTGPAWDTATAAARDLPVYHSWRFATGADGDFEALASRLRRTALGGATAAGRPAVVAGLPGGLPDLPEWTFPGALGLCPDPLPPAAFTDAMTELVDGQRVVAGLPLPPPAYGRWHALEPRLAGAVPAWLRRLNVDPRYRATAALGTRLVQEHQDALMTTAWQQIGEVEAANALLRGAQAARTASTVVHAGLETLAAQAPAAAVLLFGPLHHRVLDEVPGRTVAARVRASRVPPATVSPAFRRALRPRGPLGRRSGMRAAWVLDRVDHGLPVIPEPRPPDGMISVDHGLDPDRKRWCAITADELWERIGAPRPPASREQWEAYVAAATHQQRGMPPCAPDRPSEPPPALDLPAVGQVLLEGTRPADTIPAQVADRVTGPPGWAPADPLTPVMAAPRITTPVSRDLIALSPDLLLPGVADLPAESVAATPTNTRFVEALMVGVNHEFARELLARGYPTDQRCTSLRRFWDRSTSVAGPADDLPGIDQTWRGELGEHLVIGPSQVVLLVRGELLRRYPKTDVYAARAAWVGRSRQPVAPAPNADPGSPSHPERYPAFRGTIPPDTTFLGFDLPDDARGDPDPAAGLPGWFFVFQQPTTEVRLGLDATRPGLPLGGAADLSWPAVGRSPSGHVDLSVPLDGVTLPGWGTGASSAQLAAWCEQRPYRLCVHASDLLPRPTTPGPP